MTSNDPISKFDGKSLSYEYDNGWSFTNKFDGHLRTSNVPRGVLREHVEMVEIRSGVYFATWIDDEMGLLAQVIDVENGTIMAAIPSDNEGGAQVIVGEISEFG